MVDKGGFVFTLDSLIALVIVFLVLGAAADYVAKSETTLPNIQTIRTGSDIITLMENTNSFDSLDSEIIGNKISEILPQSYYVLANITCSDADLVETITIVVGSNLPKKKFIGTGKRFFVIGGGEITNYCITRYWIWQK